MEQETRNDSQELETRNDSQETETPETKKEGRKMKKKTGFRSPKGVCFTLANEILKGKETKKILETIHKKFPESKATAKDVSIIRVKLRKEGKLVEESAA